MRLTLILGLVAAGIYIAANKATGAAAVEALGAYSVLALIVWAWDR